MAQWGIEAVNLRDVGREAAQRNNSVVQYHFGTKELLVDSVLDLRVPEIAERFESAAAGGSDHRALAAALIGSLTELASTPEGRSTIGFLSGVLTSHHWRPVLEDREDFQALLARIASAAKSAGTPGAASGSRAKMATVLAVVTLASTESAQLPAVRADLVEAIGGLLAAGARQLAGSSRR